MMRYTRRSEDEWHQWFAWYPVRISGDNGGMAITVWFATVERKVHYALCDFAYWEYRLMPVVGERGTE